MDQLPCSNCESLKNQCKDLKNEVSRLTIKLDNLLELILREHGEKYTQTDPVNFGPSLSDNAEHSLVNESSTTDVLFDIYCQASSV